jgi:hypothetical protein
MNMLHEDCGVGLQMLTRTFQWWRCLGQAHPLRSLYSLSWHPSDSRPCCRWGLLTNLSQLLSCVPTGLPLLPFNFVFGPFHICTTRTFSLPLCLCASASECYVFVPLCECCVFVFSPVSTRQGFLEQNLNHAFESFGPGIALGSDPVSISQLCCLCLILMAALCLIVRAALCLVSLLSHGRAGR